jgi:hypothetical protein
VTRWGSSRGTPNAGRLPQRRRPAHDDYVSALLAEIRAAPTLTARMRAASTAAARVPPDALRAELAGLLWLVVEFGDGRVDLVAARLAELLTLHRLWRLPAAAEPVGRLRRP